MSSPQKGGRTHMLLIVISDVTIIKHLLWLIIVYLWWNMCSKTDHQKSVETVTSKSPTERLNWLFFWFPPYQHVISFPLGWRPFLAPHTVHQPMQSSLSAMLWECPMSRPSGNIKCQTTGTRTMSACTPTSPPSVEPSSTWCTSSSGEQSLWCMTTAQVQVQLVSVFIF